MYRKLTMEELGRMNTVEFKSSGKWPIVIVLDNIRSALNVGSIFRSADAFRIEKIICCGYTATPPHREVLKTALGATETVAWEYSEQAAHACEQLKEQGYLILACEQTTESERLDAWTWPQAKLAMIMGNEVSGVSDEALAICDQTLEIEQFGTKHSLNVAVAAGIVLYEVGRKIRESK